VKFSGGSYRRERAKHLSRNGDGTIIFLRNDCLQRMSGQSIGLFQSFGIFSEDNELLYIAPPAIVSALLWAARRGD
jgi:hypothetical protein